MHRIYISHGNNSSKKPAHVTPATEEQWDELIASEMAYVNAVQEIAHLTEEVDPSTTMQEQLRPMLRLILDNESKVKQLLQIRMDELAKLVGQSSVQKSVLSAYGDQGGFVLAPQDNPLNLNESMARE